MDFNKVAEPVQQRANPSLRVNSIAALSAKRPDPSERPISDKGDKAAEAYGMAHAEYLESFGGTTAARVDRNASAAAALAGLAIMAFASATLVWGLALVVVLGCGALAVRQQLQLVDSRNRCQTAIQKMYMEFRIFDKETGGPTRPPERPTQTSA